MNINYIIILGIFFLSITCVSASENSTDIDSINVTVPDCVFQDDLGNISVELPEKSSGNFSVKINDEVIYNEKITNKSFKVPIKLPKEKFIVIANIYPPVDVKNYKVNAFYNDIDLNISKTLKVMKYPSNISNLWNFPDEILYKSKNPLSIYFPRSANGEVEIYVDGRLSNKTKVSNPLFLLNSYLTDLNLGAHTLKIVYHGDEYYLPLNKTFHFNVERAVINIPKTVDIGHDDCISVLTKSKGTVNVYIDSVLVSSEKTTDDYYVLSLEKYLKHNSREVSVTFKSKDFTRSKTQKINITYDFDVYFTNFIYGEDNTLEIMLPDFLNNKLLNIEIDGVKYTFTRLEYIMNNIVEINISHLQSGNHTLFISYGGDERFEAKNKTLDFTVDYMIIAPGDVEFEDSSRVYLKLPGDASGNLTLYLNGNLFKTSPLVNGYCEIKIDDLSPDSYTLTSVYTGSDYNVEECVQNLWVEPKIITDYRFSAGEDKYITVKVPLNCTGYVVINNHKIKIRNGIARYSLKNFKSGEHEIDIYYYGTNNFETYNYRVVTVLKPKIKIISAKIFTNGVYAKIKVLNNKNKPISNVKVTFKISKKTYTLKSDKRGVAVLKKSLKFKKNKYKLTVKSDRRKVSKIIKKEKIIKAKNIKFKKSSRSLALSCTLKFSPKSLKGKKITFTFLGLKFTSKTDKNGVSKVNINPALFKYLRTGQKVIYQSAYGKTTITRYVAVGP